MATIPYVPTYLRATPPTIWPVTSVLDFGAIGNGSTDDYPAITAALQALIAKGGGTLVFPNDRDFRIATPGVHGIHLAGQTVATVAGDAGGVLTSLLVGAGTVVEQELLAAPVAWAGSDSAMAAAIAAAINASTGVSGFTASAYDKRFAIIAPAGSGLAYNNVAVDQAATGTLILSVGFIPRFKGGSDAGSAGESTAATEFLLTGDFFPGFSGTIASITVNGTELLAEPVEWLLNSNQTAVRVGQAILDNIDAHGFFANASKNAVFIEAPKGHGAGANGWPVVVTPTGDVTTYDVHPMSGGAPPPAATPAGTPYDLFTTIPGAPFNAVFEFAADGWKLVSLTYDQPRYPGGRPLFDSSDRLLSLDGDPIVDEFKNLKYANGSVLGWDSGMLAMGLSAPPGSGTAFGNAGMVTWDAGYLYVCTATNTWKRLALSSF